MPKFSGNSGCLFLLLRFSDKCFDVIIDDLYLTYKKDSAKVLLSNLNTVLESNAARNSYKQRTILAKVRMYGIVAHLTFM